MSILEIKNLSHRFDDKQLFEKASLCINNGEHVGVVGLNGAGKSTFINILSGKIIWDEGEVNWLNGITKGYLDQHADIDRSLTVMEYLKGSFSHLYAMNERMEKLYEDMATIEDADELEKMIDKANNLLERLTYEGFFEIEAFIKKVSNGLGINTFGYDTVIAHLSGGQRAKLMLSKLLLEQPDVMLLDEPTNFLDIEHIEWLIEYLNNVKTTFLVISHDTDFLDKVCKFVICIENGNIKKYAGNYKQFEAQREQNAKQYAESYERQQREIERMEDYINRNKARAATAGMANARKKMLERIEVIRKPTIIYDAEFSFPYVQLDTKDLLDVRDLVIGYDSPLLPAINMHLTSSTKLWIRGTNGIGKSTFIKTLMHRIPALSGNFLFHPASRIAYLEQDLEFRNLETNAAGYFSDMFPRENNKDIRTKLSKVGIKNELATKKIHELSGGEQVRIRLATLANTKSNILILDEPTNHLDVRAKDALRQALIDYDGAILLVSHEKDFATAICNDIFDVKY